MEDKLYEYEYKAFDTGWNVTKNLDFQSLKTNPDFKKLLDLEESAYFNYDNRIRFVIESSETLISLINTTLESKN